MLLVRVLHGHEGPFAVVAHVRLLTSQSQSLRLASASHVATAAFQRGRAVRQQRRIRARRRQRLISCTPALARLRLLRMTYKNRMQLDADVIVNRSKTPSSMNTQISRFIHYSFPAERRIRLSAFNNTAFGCFLVRPNDVILCLPLLLGHRKKHPDDGIRTVCQSPHTIGRPRFDRAALPY